MAIAASTPEVPVKSERVTSDREVLALQARGVRRYFGETAALESASLAVRRGEVHALLGENGSGKSTLIKVLSGVLRSDSGEVLYYGDRVAFRSPRAAQRAGIVTVYQETLVVEELSVLDNVFLGTDGFFRHEDTREAEQSRAVAVLGELGFGTFDLERPLWTFSLAQRQIVTIVRALVRPWTLLILDESTSALDQEDRDRLFDVVRAAATGDRSVIFTTHRMDEVEQIADAATVLRAGSTAGSLTRSELSRQHVLDLMSNGQHAAELVLGSSPVRQHRTAVPATDVLRAEAVVLVPEGPSISLSVHAGEILGLAGLEGQGQTRFLECAAGVNPPVSGSFSIARNGGFERVSGYRDAYRKGIAYVPRDRKREGLFLAQSVLDNLALPNFGRFSRAGLIQRRRLLKWLHTYTDELKLDRRRFRGQVGSLSGGNQQKVLLGRWMASQPALLILNDPLRGVDAVTKQELYEILRALAADGLSLLFLSTEMAELLTLCERVVVFHDSSVIAVLQDETLTEARIIDSMFGRKPDDPSDAA